jgi:hypothetical protein
MKKYIILPANIEEKTLLEKLYNIELEMNCDYYIIEETEDKFIKNANIFDPTFDDGSVHHKNFEYLEDKLVEKRNKNIDNILDVN